MSTTVLAAGTTAAESDPFTLDADETATLFMTDADGGAAPLAASATVEIKDTDSETFHRVGSLNRKMPAAILSGPGTFRVSRTVQTTAVGVCRA